VQGRRPAGSPVLPPAAESPLLFVYSHQKGEGFDVTAQKPLNVLVTSEGWQPALACIQSFGRRGHRVFLLCLDEPSLHATSRFVAGVARYPRRPTLDGLAEAVFRLAESNGIDLVVPISDDDALIAARINELFPPDSRPSAPRFVTGGGEATRLIRSRNRTIDLCRQLGIRTPATAFTDLAGLRAACEQIGFPCFVKLSGTAASQGVFKLGSAAEIDRVAAGLPADGELQVQEPVSGDFVGVTGYCRSGRVAAAFGFRVAYDLSGGGTPAHATRFDDPAIHRVLDALAAAVEWTGGIDVDLLATADGGHAVLEINPRLSGTAIFAQKLGIDLAAGYLPEEEPLAAIDLPGLDPLAAGYVSLAEEARLIARGREAARERAARFRRERRCVDNAFADDPGYSRELALQIERIRAG